MDANNNLTVGSGTRSVAEPTPGEARRGRNARPWVNWGLALATVPAAAIVMLFALGAVMSTDGCSERTCPNLGRGGIAGDPLHAEGQDGAPTSRDNCPS